MVSKTAKALIRSGSLSAVERTQREFHEGVIEQGFNTACSSLLVIRDKRLYRETHATFEAYCRERWGITRQHANRMIAAAAVMANLEPIGSIPDSESQARELVGLDPEAQRVVWELAVKTAPDGKVTAAHVRSLATVAEGVLAAGAIDDGTGEMVPWDDLEANQKRALLEANLSEETYERHQRQQAHVSKNTGDVEWFTPGEFIEPARKVLGKIDLDPASTAAANKVVKATHFYTSEDDGLTLDWKGRVWMNPPFKQPLISQFIDKMVGSYQSKLVTAAIVLVNNATETEWFYALVSPASAICFPSGRVRFWHPDKKKAAPLQGQAVVYLGPSPATFHARFSELGIVWVKP